MTLPLCKAPHWRSIQKENYRDLERLIRDLGFDEETIASLLKQGHFPLNLPKRLAAKIEPNNLHDPLFLQFVPLKKESEETTGYTLDPVMDGDFKRSARLLQKYHGRALLVTTGACAMHCRYCFRQNYDYSEGSLGLDEEIQLLEQDPTIQEVILSGGDPLSLPDQHLRNIVERIRQIPHIKLIRFHSRFVMGIPERITDELLQTLAELPQQVYFVIHANHANEFDGEVYNALKRIQKLGIPILCQSVLLRDVNDDIDSLYRLYNDLIAHGILPYYLFQLDQVKGAAHFHVSIEQGKRLISQLRLRLPGYAIPTYAWEIPHEKSKTPLA